MKKKPIHSRIYKKNIITHCTCEDFYQKKMQRKQLLYFDNYVFGGHMYTSNANLSMWPSSNFN